MMRVPLHLFPLALIAILCALLFTACDPKPLVNLRSSADLTKLQIEIFENGKASPETLYVIKQETAQQLYKAALASPQLAPGRACPTIGGPGYQLVFWAGAQRAETVIADRSGCEDLFLRGGDLRQANQDFWSLLDQAITSAPHVTHPDHLEIVRYQGNVQVPLYGKITSTRQVQRLFTYFSAFLSTPPSTTGFCGDQAPTYDDLFFYEGEVLLRAQVFRGDCSQLRMAGKTTFPALHLTEQFQQQLDQELSSMTFAPVRPDKLEIKHAPTSIQPGSGPDFRISIDQSTIQKLYRTAYNLLPWPSNKDSSCNSQGTAGSYDMLTFSQEDAWLVSATAFSGCPTVSFNRAGIEGGYMSQATQEFWDLVHQVEKG
ncbi:hypothetical protein [Ktedonobacter racemifer]|uniref:Lipoprotein n=1 Tax=Ktedonobacter racemifer DSM 44963 TaxID=485913 RepID=D6TWD1_KTERA|nr:hypothetical protein [Ktedonobacter racemifer]EFH84514.1 hypothetical protein Krac_5578 [Ktedonobacter racemifer DSM 44963]